MSYTPISKEEINKALFDMSSFKAIEPNGLHASFYQKMWSIVGETVCKFVIDFLIREGYLMGVNDTFISLIPKVRNPKVVGQLRSISFFNVSSMLITKILTNRLTTVMAIYCRSLLKQFCA